jgi:hypothetical protein
MLRKTGAVWILRKSRKQSSPPQDMEKKMKRAILALLTVLSVSAPALAGTWFPSRQITQIGCDNSGNCAAVVNTPVNGGAGCTSASYLYWTATGDAGKNILSMLTAAYLAGKYVDFYVVGCATAYNDPVQATFGITQFHN